MSRNIRIGILTSLFLLSLLLVIPQAAGIHGANAQGENVLNNPGFEQLDGGAPIAWEANNNWRTNELASSSAAARSGNTGVRLETNADRWLRQTVAVEGGQAYELTAWLKSNISEMPVGNVQMKVEFYRDTTGADSWEGDMFGDGYGTFEDWEQISMQVEIPENANLAQVYLRLYGPGVAQFDDISFHPIDKLLPRGVNIQADKIFYYTDDTQGTVTGTIGPDDHVYENKTIEVQLYPENGGEAIVHDVLPAAEDFHFQFDPSPMQTKQAYHLEVSLKSQQGELLAADYETIYRWERPTALREDGTLLVAGEPFFVRLGYHVEVEDYPHVKDSINTVQGIRDERANLDTIRYQLDEAHMHGLKVFYPLYPHMLNLEGPIGLNYVRDVVTEFKDHPAILGWMISDEPNKLMPRSRSLVEDLASVYQMIRSIDPVHPTYMVIAHPPAVGSLGRLTDIVVTNPYPLSAEPITTVSDHVNNSKTLHPDKPNWNVLQSFWLPEHPAWPYLPNITELRNMAYQSILEGTQGLAYYSFRDPSWNLMEDELYTGIVEFTNKEIPHFSNIVLYGEQIDAYKDEYVQWGLYEHENDLYAAVINVTEEMQTTTIPLPSEGFHVGKFAPHHEQFALVQDALEIELPPLESILMKLTPFRTVSEIKERIDQYEQDGKISNPGVARALKMHLTSVEHFEQANEHGKVVKHMKGFFMLIDHHVENGGLSKEAYLTLKADVQAVIQKTTEKLLSMHVNMKQGKVAAGEDLELFIHMQNLGTSIADALHLTIQWPDEFGLDDQLLKVQHLQPHETKELSIVQEIPREVSEGYYPVRIQLEYVYDDEEMENTRVQKFDVIQAIEANLNTKHVRANKAGTYPFSVNVKNSSWESKTVQMDADLASGISLNVVSPVTVEGHSVMTVEGDLAITKDVLEGEYEGLIHFIVDGKVVDSLTIIVEFNSNLIENPSFEVDVEGDYIPDGWRIQAGERVTDVVYDGQHAITLFPNSENNWNVISSDKAISLEAGRTYRFTGWSKNTSTSGGVLIGVREANARGSSITYNWHETLPNSDWTKYEFEFAASSTTIDAFIYMQLEQEANGQVWFDDFRLEEVTEPNLVLNSGFEIDEDGDQIPDGWHIRVGAWVLDEVYSGQYAVTLFPDQANNWNVINSRINTRVEPGKTYRLSGWSKTNSSHGGASIGVREVAADGRTSIAYQWKETGVNAEWTQHVLEFVTGVQTQFVNVYMILDQDSDGQVWFDEFVLIEVTE